jgi:hypothetical protein
LTDIFSRASASCIKTISHICILVVPSPTPSVDKSSGNVNILPLFHAPPHPFGTYLQRDWKDITKIRFSHTRKPVKHYLIDFGLSKIYKPEEAPHLEPGGWGGDRSVPEFLAGDNALCDPFPVDVYCMGNFIRKNFTEVLDRFLGANSNSLRPSSLRAVMVFLVNLDLSSSANLSTTWFKRILRNVLP